MTYNASVRMGNDPSPEAQEQQAEHERQMAERGGNVASNWIERDGEGRNPAGAGPATAPPPGIPEKFWDPETGQVRTEDLLKSYQELEKRLSQPKPDEPPAPPPAPEGETPEGETPEGETPAQQSAIERASAEWAEKGELTAETYEALEKSGIPRAMVDQYVAGAQAQQAALEQKAYSIAGGPEGYKAMAEWASTNLSDAELNAFNQDVADPARVESAVSGLRARYQAANGFDGNRVAGAKPASGDVFRSRHEMMSAMNDPRYRQGDRSFHEEVYAKIANSSAAGIDLSR